MPLRNSFTYRDLVKVLKHFGCRLGEQGKGSHETRYSPIIKGPFTIFYHSGTTFKIKTLLSILEDAGISKQEVIDYLNKK